MVKLIMEKDHMEKLYSSKNPLIKYIFNKNLEVVINSIPKKEGIKILDAGCGEGHLLLKISKSFKNIKIYGTDITEVALENAKKRIKNGKFLLQNLENLNYPDNFFDVITCVSVIEHIPNYKNVLIELKRVLKNGGVLIISFPNEILWTIGRFFLGRNPIKIPDHVNSFSPKKIIKETGLEYKKKREIPFKLPYPLSLTSILTFRK